jgi:hypothetical protein
MAIPRPLIMCAKWAICVLRARHWIIHATKINATLSALVGGRDRLSFFGMGIGGVSQRKTSAASRLLERTKKLLFCDIAIRAVTFLFCLLRVLPFRPRQTCKNRLDWRRPAGNHVRRCDSVFINLPVETMQYGNIHSDWYSIQSNTLEFMQKCYVYCLCLRATRVSDSTALVCFNAFYLQRRFSSCEGE